jgi:transposase
VLDFRHFVTLAEPLHFARALRTLAKRYGINQKTVAKWKKRTSVADLPTGPKEAKSSVLSVEDEAIVIAFRRHTLLPLDDCLYALQPTIPHLTRSSLHRCLQRHGISRLPDVEGGKPDKRKFVRIREKSKLRAIRVPAARRLVRQSPSLVQCSVAQRRAMKRRQNQNRIETVPIGRPGSANVVSARRSSSSPPLVATTWSDARP